mmetsp:Transcript_24050/g.36547  ORF Transcript_24050/g.36547 Transcript_24050/m.36547 type:complete len:140 (+) Transcript_24050:87-506(+)
MGQKVGAVPILATEKAPVGLIGRKKRKGDPIPQVNAMIEAMVVAETRVHVMRNGPSGLIHVTKKNRPSPATKLRMAVDQSTTVETRPATVAKESSDLGPDPDHHPILALVASHPIRGHITGVGANQSEAKTENNRLIQS